MRKSRILSLLLAVAVMATMLIAVPLTASAASEPVTWDPSQYEQQIDGVVDPPEMTVGEVLTVDPLDNRDSAAEDDNDAWKKGTDTVTGITGAGNPKPSGYNGNPSETNIPASGTVLKVSVAKDGKLKFTMSVGNGTRQLTGYILEVKNGDSTGTYVATYTNQSTTEKHKWEPEIDAKAGYYYYAFVPGSKSTFGTITFTPATDDPTFTIEPESADIQIGKSQDVSVTVRNYKTYTASDVTWTPSDSEKVQVSKGEGGTPVTISVTDKAQANEQLTVEAKLPDDANAPAKTFTINVKEADKLNPVSESTTWTFDAIGGGSNITYSDNVFVGENNTLLIRATSKKPIRIDIGEEKTVRDGKVQHYLNFQGGPSSGNTDRVAEIMPAVAGTITVYGNTSHSGSGNRNLHIKQGEKTIDGTADTDNINFSLVVKANELVQIYGSGGGTNVYAVYFDPINVFGTTTGTESGYYTEGDVEKTADDSAKGVIRFFQSFEGDTSVEEYGFYFLNSKQGSVVDGYANKASEQGTVNINTLPGMYGDLVEIQYDHFGTTYYALPFVKIGGEIVYGTPISGSVGVGAKQVSKPVASD